VSEQPYWNYDAKPCQCCGQIHDGAEVRVPLAALVTKWRDAAETMSVSGEGVWQEAKRDCADELEAALAAERPSNHTSVQRAANLED